MQAEHWDPHGPTSAPTTAQFSASWDAAAEFVSMLRRLPSAMVEKAGLAYSRSRILNSWERLDLNSIMMDGASSEDMGVVDDVRSKSETLISYVVKVGRDSRGASHLRRGITYSDPTPHRPPPLMVVTSVSDSSFSSDQWAWPWSAAKSKASKKWAGSTRILKVGTVAALGAIALAVYVDEEEV